MEISLPRDRTLFNCYTICRISNSSIVRGISLNCIMNEIYECVCVRMLNVQFHAPSKLLNCSINLLTNVNSSWQKIQIQTIEASAYVYYTTRVHWLGRPLF